jgi:diguanylate cyclase (GGDEF)-like protein/PAS domain S-box-containing protein
MGKPLRIVVVGDEHGAALRVGEELEACGYEPAIFLAAGEAELDRLAPASEIVIARADAGSLTAARVLELARERRYPPVVVVGEGFSEDELVGHMRAGARDCVRRGDHRRLEAAVERERLAVRPTPAAETRVDGNSAESYRALIEEIPALTYVAWADEAGSRAYVSPQLLAMTGFSPGEWLAEPDMWVRRLHPEDRERVLRQFREACASGGRFASEYRILDYQGRVVWWRDEGRVLPGPDGKARFVRGFVLDITEQRIAEESLRRLRLYDQLTGLPNRMMLLNRLGRALVESARTARPVSLLILKLDRFKDLNNTLGYHNADLIVRDMAARIGDALGDADRVARLRGHEFGVLLPDADGLFARQVAERVLGSLDKPFVVQRLAIEVSASIGIAVAPEHATEAEGLLRRANSAMEGASKLGGGACLIYSPELDSYDPARLALLGELRRALEGNELQLHYQPKVDLKTHSVVGAEALLRWPHARRGFVSPGVFIPDAEKTGLIRQLTRWVLDRAAGEARAWERAGRRLPVSINISARSLQDGRIVDDVEEALLTHDMRADRLQIEVTESAVMLDENRAVEVLASLASRGVSVSIDDFGMGFTSLNLLRRLPVHELKIDRSFVDAMSREAAGAEDTAIVRSTADLAHNLGLTAVAEGVENQWTLDLLASFGCDQAQGFHIAKPMPSADFVGWLGASSWRVLES